MRQIKKICSNECEELPVFDLEPLEEFNLEPLEGNFERLEDELPALEIMRQNRKNSQRKNRTYRL